MRLQPQADECGKWTENYCLIPTHGPPTQICDQGQKHSSQSASMCALLHKEGKRWTCFPHQVCSKAEHDCHCHEHCVQLVAPLQGKEKRCVLQGPSGREVFTGSQLSPGWKPNICRPSCLKWPTSSIIPLKSKGFSHKALKTGLPGSSRDARLSSWKCAGSVLVQVLVLAKSFPSLSLTFLLSTTWREGLSINVSPSMKYQQCRRTY